MTTVLPILIICSFTLWTVYEEGKLASGLQTIFLLALAAWIGLELLTYGPLSAFPILAVGFLGLAAYGFLIQRLVTNNPGRILLATLMVSPFFIDNINPLATVAPITRTSTVIDPDMELLVKLEEGAPPSVIQHISTLPYIQHISTWQVADADITTLDNYILVDIVDGTTPYRAARQLEGITGVKWIEENEQWSQIADMQATSAVLSKEEGVAAANIVNDPRVGDQWNYQQLQLDRYHALIASSRKKPVRPAILYIVDSGVDFRHEDLQATVRSHPAMDQDLNQSDKNGHGTHCAGVAAAVSNNGIGVASLSPGTSHVVVGSVAAMNRFGIATQARIIESVIEAIDAGADVINMSFGGLSNQMQQEAYRDLCQYAAKKNVILVAAAGNSAADASKYVPSGRDEVITVAATDRYGNKAQFSNYISNTSYGIAAPGTSILSTYMGTYASFDGTSMAAPHVAGLIAVMRAYDPSLTTAQAHRILSQTGQNTSDTPNTGKLIQPAAALAVMLDK